MTRKSIICRHCYLLVYEAPGEPGRWWHNARADEVSKHSIALGIKPSHDAEPYGLDGTSPS